ncbi:mCG147089 [Mus musculus]|nr:mCG147089 [Mus musculus]
MLSLGREATVRRFSQRERRWPVSKDPKEGNREGWEDGSDGNRSCALCASVKTTVQTSGTHCIGSLLLDTRGAPISTLTPFETKVLLCRTDWLVSVILLSQPPKC